MTIDRHGATATIFKKGGKACGFLPQLAIGKLALPAKISGFAV
ncbi:hypothetical protein SDC9_98951 [bioreactor metagenome]|uniref:Uncharacterized protein n=1 Tax=bioreactor metagenome TaxID=1076179 RepID=A0A645AG65_9ZZZZ